MDTKQLDAIRASWESLADRANIDYSNFYEFAKTCDIYPIEVAREVVGGMFVHDKDVHVCVLPKAIGKWSRKCHLRILQSVIDKHGYAQTSATTQAGVDFVEKLGFVKFGDVYRKK